MTDKHFMKNRVLAWIIIFGSSVGVWANPLISISPADFTNTLVVAGETAVQTMVISNAGNAEIDFSLCSPPEKDGVEGLILHYTFDDDSGTVVTDQSGNENHGTLMNHCEHVDGVDGLGVKIHGNSSSYSSRGGHVMMPSLDFNSMEELTVAVWVKELIVHHDHGQSYLSIGAGAPVNKRIFISNYAKERVVLGVSDEVSSYVNAEPAIGQFVHYSITYSGGTMRAYRNGELLGETETTLSVEHPERAALGRSWWSDGRSTSTRLTAVYDDVRIYNRALSPDEISALIKVPDNDGLVASYPFNGNTEDESGNGHDGTVFGATLTEDRFGNPDSAYYFNGLSHIIVPDNPSLHIETNEFAISVWVKTSVSRPQMIFQVGGGQGSGDPQLWSRLYDGHGVLTFLTGDSAPPSEIVADSSSVLADGSWHHIVSVRNGEGLALYLDGQLIASEKGAARNVNSDQGMIIGRQWHKGSYVNGFIGNLDDLCIYNRALTVSEIQELYAEGEENEDAVAHYPFNGNAADESGNGHDGTVFGAMLTEDRFGNPDSAYEFDGQDDYIDIGNCLGIEATPFTVSLWILSTNLPASGGEIYIAKKDRGLWRPGQWSMSSRAGDSSFVFNDYNGNNLPPRINSVERNIHDGVWHHLCGVMSSDGSRYYIDGECVGTNTVSLLVSQHPGKILIGGRNDAAAPYYAMGSIDDVRIYNRVLFDREIMELYSESPGQECGLPEWLVVEPKSGTIPADSDMEVELTFIATNRFAGDYASHELEFFDNDSGALISSVPVSMWVVPQAPIMVDEPCRSEGKANEVFWSLQGGAVEYWVEAIAMQHCAPGRACCSEESVPPGWQHQNRFKNNPERWSQQAGWLTASNHVFTGLQLNTRYQYRVKASVMTDIGRLEGAWSEPVVSCQVPHLKNGNKICIPDWWKEKHFKGGRVCNADADTDGDGLCNLKEYISGHNPCDKHSFFKVKGRKSKAAEGYEVEWESVPGRVYSIYWSANLGSEFQMIEEGIRYPQNTYVAPLDGTKAGGFYKVVVELDE